MSNLAPYKKILIHAYKHNGQLYRIWNSAIVFKETDDYLVVINDNVTVTEVNGRKWKANEPAVWIFYKKNWFNVICMFKDYGINYYCNIASPYIIEDETLKYIDYDLDVKVFNDGSYKILDLKDFNRNRIEWSYPHTMIDIIWNEVDTLKKLIKKRKDFFDHINLENIWFEFNNKKHIYS
ncbi:DUF402 domain-containing protein [Spiroplasma endosymbiont of Labia minor]|uniref:DUF402 domain-containing protein n=1 Tax=Spiroplasma endosymbiont of Labia minor TaxID=3066305 RepID=UPI0030D36C37